MRQHTIKIVVAIVAIAAVVVAFRFLPIAAWLTSFQAWVRGLGPIGYVVYTLMYAVCVAALVPASLLTIGAGANFGVVGGTIVVVAGATLGAMLAFFLARTVLRGRVERMIAKRPKFAAVDRAIAKEGTKLMLLCRISGFPPFILANYTFGLTGVGTLAYFLTTFFGIIPGSFAYTYAGHAGAAVATGSGNRIGLIVTAVGIVLVAAYVARIATRAIHRAGVDDA
ncbi:MAG TPA: VTT domain-containing protein [Thermoanaerobaculia bacterium]|nr:VTT domain-containing protein [Thermoanaerobaculia bacterium]